MNIPLSKPKFYPEEVEEIKKVLESGWLTQGPKTSELEKRFAQYCNAKHAVVVNSGTAALHLALIAHNIKKGDEVIIPTITFVATPNSVMLQNAKPVFAEVNQETCNISMDDVRKKITDKTKAIIPVHLYGNPAEMKELMEIAEENDLTIIEDAAQAHGTEYHGKKIGSLGNTACFSFHPMKNMTTGEGGAIVSDDEDLMDKIKILRSHGEATPAWQRFNMSEIAGISEHAQKPKVFDKKEIKKRSYIEVGYNYRMSDILAALGLVQLKHLDENNNRRIELAKIYTDCLSKVESLKLPSVKEGIRHIFHMYVIRTEKRNELASHLSKKGIKTGIYYNPCHLEEAYVKRFNYKEGYLPVAEMASKQILSLPIYPDLDEEEINYIVNTISEFKK